MLHAYTIENEDGFDTNLIITKSLLPPELDYEQFWTVNTNKLKQYVQGYTPGDKEILRISCGSQDITGLYVTFAVQDSVMQNGASYYMAQLQFVTDEQGYILSYATATQKEQNDMKKIFKNR